jgi:hypothetical protein
MAISMTHSIKLISLFLNKRLKILVIEISPNRCDDLYWTAGRTKYQIFICYDSNSSRGSFPYENALELNFSDNISWYLHVSLDRCPEIITTPSLSSSGTALPWHQHQPHHNLVHLQPMKINTKIGDFHKKKTMSPKYCTLVASLIHPLQGRDVMA